MASTDRSSPSSTVRPGEIARYGDVPAAGARSRWRAVIELRHLTKRYGRTLAVDDLSVDVRPGRVTGFLGPNGAGKSTTMRLVLGLDRPTAGTAHIDGRPYRRRSRPLGQVGALLEASAIHPGRRARDHLLWLAQTNGIARSRIDQVLDLVGLTEVAGRRTGTFSLGMAQRLGIAAALIGDPHTLLLDEPMNGLDPEGFVWIRGLLRSLAADGRTVFVSSHLMGEMSQLADHLVVIARGRLLADTTVDAFIDRTGTRAHRRVRVRSPEADRLAALVGQRGAAATVDAAGTLTIVGIDAGAVGEIASRHGVAVHELTTQQASLEDAFMALTSDADEPG
jgi:ABC-2 type transport system ATP-binding protein